MSDKQGLENYSTSAAAKATGILLGAQVNEWCERTKVLDNACALCP